MLMKVWYIYVWSVCCEWEEMMKRCDHLSIQRYNVLVLAYGLSDLVFVLSIDLVGNAEILELLDVGIGHN